MNLADINGEHIARADFRQDKPFENFVRELLEHELTERHQSSADIEGPMQRYVGDGQRDLVFRVASSPSISRDADYHFALTWDDVGEVWYSCKGGAGWAQQIKDELGNSSYAKHQKDGSSPGDRVKHKPSKVLLEHLKGGGRYVFVISQQTLDPSVLLDQISGLLAFWLEHHALPVPIRLREQLALIDANRLAAFIRHHKPTLSTSVMAALDAQEPDAVMSVEAWARRITPGRQPPQFEGDALRKQIMTALQTQASARILRVYGAPGVGKTRLVYEALTQHNHDRVRYSDEPDRLLDSLRQWLPRSHQLTLVVDEVRSLDASELVRRFMADATQDSRMIMVGISDADANHDFGGDVATFPLAVLSADATRALINREFEQSGVEPDSRTATILELSEGYPLFAVKLAEALARDGDALVQGSDETNKWWAAQRVLVGPRTGVDSWESKVERRGRCLLVVLLTGATPMEWEQLWEDHGDQLAKAVDWDADELRRARAACIEREILREVDSRHRYVSPANLVRILLNHYLGGPPDLGDCIVRHAPKFSAHLMDLAQRAHVQPEALRRFASAHWRELGRVIDQRDVAGIEHLLDWSNWDRTCEVDPVGAAGVYAKLVDAVATKLRPTTVRAVAQVLAHVTRRRLDADSFERAERAMFRLGLLDEDGYARETWATLFLVALSPTHQPWSLRFGLLAGHARAAAVSDRRMVATMLPSLLGDQRRGPAYFEPDKLDGDWPVVSAQEHRDGRCQLWELAVELTADVDPSVAQLARAATAKRLSEGGIRITTIDALASGVGGWTPQQRQPLLETVRDLLRLRHDELEAAPHNAAALERLARALEPVDLTSQVIAQVSATRWPGPWSSTNEAARRESIEVRDRELAEDLIRASDDVHDPIIVWLASPKAVRAWAFMVEVGRADLDRVMLDPLLVHARASEDQRLLAAYLAGWADQAPEDADAWLREHAGGEFTASVTAALAACAPTHQRFELLEALVDAQLVDATDMRRFAERRWILAVDPARALGLLEAMRTLHIAPTSGLQMSLRLLEQPLEQDQRQLALDLLDSFLADSSEQHIPMIAQLAWQQGALLLAKSGRTQAAADRVVALLAYDKGNLGLAEQVLGELLVAGHGRELWVCLRDAMLDPSQRGSAAHLASVGMLRHLDPDDLLRWIGVDEARASLVARMCNPYREQLGPIIEVLLQRFGSAGPIAEVLRTRALTSPLATSALEFERRQHGNAKAWSQRGEIPEVQAWAQALALALHEQIQAYELRDQLRRQYA